MYAHTLLDTIRNTVGDTAKERWLDSYIYSLMNEAQEDFASKTKILKTASEFPLISGQSIYHLEDKGDIISATYKGKHLDKIAHSTLDRTVENWELEKSSTPTHIVYGRMNLGDVRVYPTPDDTLEDLGYLKVYHITSPEPIEDGNSIVNEYIPKRAIVLYVSAELLKNDLDTQNRAFSQLQSELYLKELEIATKLASYEYVDDDTNKNRADKQVAVETTYRLGV